jgi:hypothetical protein
VKRAWVVVSLLVASPALTEAQTSDTAPAETRSSVLIRCDDCGVIESIRETETARPGGPPNTSSTEPIGLIMYVPVGRKSSKDEMYVGSVGNREWQERTQNTRYEFTVRMNNGRYTFAQKQGVSDLAIGDRVRVNRGQIERVTE